MPVTIMLSPLLPLLLHILSPSFLNHSKEVQQNPAIVTKLQASLYPGSWNAGDREFGGVLGH